MPRRRLVCGSIVALVMALLTASVDAQFPKIRVPKAPSVPGVGSPPAPASVQATKLETVTITDDMIQRYLKAFRVQKEVLAREMVEANALQAKADALAKKRAEHTVGEIMKNAACKDAFTEKDARAKEIARLEDLVAQADTAGDEKKSDALRAKLDPLNEALELDADRACGGKGSAALHDCMDKQKQVLAKQGVTEPMLTIQAQGECMSHPETSGAAGATDASAEEQAASKAASERMQQARENAEKAGRDAAGLEPRLFAMIDHCVWRRLRGDPCDADPNMVIDKYKAELEKELKR
jgi:hypothetical protein